MAAFKFFLVASFVVASALALEPASPRVKKDLLLTSGYVAPAFAAAPAIAAPVYPAVAAPVYPAVAAPVIPAVAAPVIPAASSYTAASFYPAASYYPAVRSAPTAYSTSYRVDYPSYPYAGIHSYAY